MRSHHCLVLKKINLSKDTFAFSFFPFLQCVIFVLVYVKALDI